MWTTFGVLFPRSQFSSTVDVLWESRAGNKRKTLLKTILLSRSTYLMTNNLALAMHVCELTKETHKITDYYFLLGILPMFPMINGLATYHKVLKLYAIYVC